MQLVLASLLLAIFTNLAAGTSAKNLQLAEYYLAAPAERFVFVARHWRISRAISTRGLIFEIRIKDGATERTWPVDLMWLADRVNSDSICTGRHELKMKEYLQFLQNHAEKPLIIEIVSQQKQGPQFVAGIWLYSPDELLKHGPTTKIPLSQTGGM